MLGALVLIIFPLSVCSYYSIQRLNGKSHQETVKLIGDLYLQAVSLRD